HPPLAGLLGGLGFLLAALGVLQLGLDNVLKNGGVGRGAVFCRRIGEEAALVEVGALLNSTGLAEGLPFLAFRHRAVGAVAFEQRRTVVRIVSVCVRLLAQAFARLFRSFQPVRIVFAV